jgi:phosphatidylinositol alpha 1,6-mannosyltransferase
MSVFPPRVAYFPDSFYEVNGVAHTSRHFEAFARRRNLPFLCIHPGEHGPSLKQEGSVWALELPRGSLSFALEKDLRFDPAFLRHVPFVSEVMERFRPDIIHVTGPSEVGALGAGLALHMEVPLASSWHTNVHEYASRRANWLLRMLPSGPSAATGQTIENAAMVIAAGFYRAAGLIFAPNFELCAMLERWTGRPTRLMPRGVDAELFSPEKRACGREDCEPVLGFVGRLSIEKNVTHLATVQDELERMGLHSWRWRIVGHGAEEPWLRERLHRAEFTGVLHGEELARAYAGMDLLVFPSHTDTFGNVVLEALASGVPAVVTPDGGPKTIVRDGVTGCVVPDEEFSSAIAAILADPAKHAAMRQAARAHALTASWDSVFEGVYAGYQSLLPVSRPCFAAG